MSETSSYKLLYQALEDFLNENHLTLNDKNGYNAHVIFRNFSTWLFRKGYAMYDTKKNGLFRLENECACAKSVSNDPEKELFKEMLLSLAKVASTTGSLEDIADGPELERIVDWYESYQKTP